MASDRHPSNRQKEAPTFSKILLCSAHGLGASSTARFFDITAQLPSSPANNDPSSYEKELVTAAQGLQAESLGTESYRIDFSGFSKTHVTMSARHPSSQDPLDPLQTAATFKIPIFYGFKVGSTTIALSTPDTDSERGAGRQRTIEVKMHGKVYTREQSFVYNSVTYVWKVGKGAQLRLVVGENGNNDDVVVAKFFFTAKWFASSGVLLLLLGEGGLGHAAEQKEEEEGFEVAVVASLIVCLRREREMRYNAIGHGVPIKRTWI